MTRIKENSIEYTIKFRYHQLGQLLLFFLVFKNIVIIGNNVESYGRPKYLIGVSHASLETDMTGLYIYTYIYILAWINRLRPGF